MTDPRVTELGRRQALLARMRDVAREVTGDEPVRRVHLTVAIDRFLVRLLATTPWGTWVLKGGYANQLRHPGEARFTEDVDLRIDGGIDAASGMVAAAIGCVLDDPFTYELPAPPRRLPGPPGGGLRFVVVARVAGAELVRFKLDISFKRLLLGGIEVGQNTLLRFYVLHVMALPLIAASFLAVHFWRIREDGAISGPL